MSTLTNIDLARLSAIADKYAQGVYQLGTLPEGPHSQALKELVHKKAPQIALKKKIDRALRTRTSATKLLRLWSEVIELGLGNKFPELQLALINEASRLITRALKVSALHGSRARVNLATLANLVKYDFLKETQLQAVESAMETSIKVRAMINEINCRNNELFVVCLCVEPKKAPASAPTRNKKRTTKAAYLKAKKGNRKKPITKAAYLRANPKSSKANAKGQRILAAEKRRQNKRKNGKNRRSKNASGPSANAVITA